MKVILIFAAYIASTFAGVVIWNRCGGVGTFRELRITGCEGPTCFMTAGTPYPCEGDLVPSSASARLRLFVTAYVFNADLTILDVPLENSSVQPGIQYTIRFTVTPNDVLAGSTLRITARISDIESEREEICFSFQVRIDTTLLIP